MRFLIPCYLDPGTSDLPLFLARALSRLGHDVRLFAYDVELTSWLSVEAWRLLGGDIWSRPCRIALFGERVRLQARRWRPDVVLYTGLFSTPRHVRCVQRLGAKVGCLLGYNTLFAEDYAQTLAAMDFVVAHDSYLLPLLRQIFPQQPWRVAWLPAACDPDEHRPRELTEGDRERYGAEVAFIGAVTPHRASLLRSLREFDLRIWGYAACDCEVRRHIRDEPVYGLKKTRIYQASAIVLNLQEPSKQVNAISVRVAEALACGGFVITDWHPDLERSPLRPGESVVAFRDPRELPELVQHYLEHPAERRAIANRGHLVARTTMTWDAVVRQLLSDLHEFEW